MSNPPFRILSLDGGGIRGLYSAAVLAHLEKQTQKSLIAHFDLVVGTSTGSIIALGLASGVPASDILAFYQKHGPVIFSRPATRVGRLFHPKYKNDALIRAIRDILGEHTLDDLKIPVCVPSYELSDGMPRVFKDNHHPDLHWGGGLPIWKIAAASSAAPTYFPAFQVDEADSHVDGGIWANNPIVVGIAEAVRYFDQPLDHIAAVSIGTGCHAFRLSEKEARTWGLVGWGRRARILSLVMDAQARSAHHTAAMMLKRENYLRIDADLTTAMPLDEYQIARVLLERGAQAGRTYKTEIERKFLAWPSTTARVAAQTKSEPG
jgi:patatin-like phospholipase/acyl hydrolase